MDVLLEHFIKMIQKNYALRSAYKISVYSACKGGFSVK